jgi:hypothetical protein
MFSPFAIICAGIVLWFIYKPKPAYPVYKGSGSAPQFRCRHCRKRYHENHDFCPKCKLDDNGQTIQERLLHKIEYKLHKQDQEMESINHRLGAVDRLIEIARRNTRK